MIITENQLDVWVRGNSREAQGAIPELVARLVAASSPGPKERRFPLGDSIGQPGPDGELDTDFAFAPYVPEGRSFWEVGTNEHPGTKATSDYNGLTTSRTTAIPALIRAASTFIFVTPLSAIHGWSTTAQTRWVDARKGRGQWRDIRVIDGTRLTEWLHQFPAVEIWLAKTMRLPVQQLETPEWHWGLLRTIGEPPPLHPNVFLANRSDACAKLDEVFSGTTRKLRLETRFPEQVANFVAAYLAGSDESSRLDAGGRCLLVSGAEAWNAVAAYTTPHFLVADSPLDLNGDAGTMLIQRALRSGHAIVFGGPPGGIPDPSSVSLPFPQGHQLQDALGESGYTEERARTFAQKSNGDLGSLLRCLQNLSVLPEWGEGTAAAELAIAAALGSWNEAFEADRTVVEIVSGKAYGEWIGAVRQIALRPGTPLSQHDRRWKFVARYEGWYALGPHLFDDQLDRLKGAAVSVLGEQDPQFELPEGERYAARIHGRILTHSHELRSGLAEALALLGSHPNALKSATIGKAEDTAAVAVRELLNGADWVRWASLNDLLPLLAEAAPGEFLDAAEDALKVVPCPFDQVFAQEGDGLLGRNYMTGLLWALETLAWDADHLTRVLVCLGELASRDLGGRWANRPANSLSTILLPWLPQTCAPLSRRVSAAMTLLAELPDVGWTLLVSLLPESHPVSSGSRKPEWRDTIPEGWTNGVSRREYWEQVARYWEMAIAAAVGESKKLAVLVDHMGELPPEAQGQLLAELGSGAVASFGDDDRQSLWTKLVNLVAKHRKYSDAEWAMKPEQVDRIAAVADRMAPTAPALKYRRLFTERSIDLYEERGNWEEQNNELEARRQQALIEVAADGGTEAVVRFASTVESPWRVGFAFGAAAGEDSDTVLLPQLLQSDQPLSQFVGGYVRGRFFGRGWSWVDGRDMARWAATDVGQLLSFLPFRQEAWARSRRLLGEDESDYWTSTPANPYEAEDGLADATDQLIKYGRPSAALGCLHWMLAKGMPVDVPRAVNALVGALHSQEGPRSLDAYDMIEIIKALQDDPATKEDDLFQIEWAYLPLLERDRGAWPRLLERRLATEPRFFCEVIRLVFKSKNDDNPREEPTETRQTVAKNAYHLLSEWRTPPGSVIDGPYSTDALGAWLEAVKTECSETGHLEIAMTMTGHVLAHAPADPDGLWIHHGAAAVLNAKEAKDLRNGFATELFNERGVHFVDPTGKPEQELAFRYHEQADAVESAGYHRLANSLRQLASSYEREAERVRSDHLDD